ncbi:unnamed protein product [Ectocarpus fasciculatus]
MLNIDGYTLAVYVDFCTTGRQRVHVHDSPFLSMTGWQWAQLRRACGIQRGGRSAHTPYCVLLWIGVYSTLRIRRILFIVHYTCLAQQERRQLTEGPLLVSSSRAVL